MSAFVVSTSHIATCAQIVREIVFHYDDAPPSDESIRMDLAMANIISVTWRYGPEGREAYAKSMAGILEQLSDAGWETIETSIAESTSDANVACFEDGYTVSNYLADCRAANASTYNNAEAFQYLSCLEYQSCEPPGWEKNKVRDWIISCQVVLGARLAREILSRRHVWELSEPAAETVTA